MARRILIAEDDEEVRLLVSTYLADEGFDTDCAAHGAEALELARRSPPDLLILDVNMPVMDAPKVLEAWSHEASLKSIPVLLVSGAAGLSELAEHYKIRSSLAKPFDLDVLRVIVEQLLAHPEAPTDVPTISPSEEDGL